MSETQWHPSAVTIGLTMTDQYTRPDFKKIALITIDVQRDFLDDGVCAVPGTTAVLPRIAALLSAFREARLPIIHVVRIYRADGSNVDLCRRAAVESGRAIAQPGTPGMELADALSPLGAASLDSGLPSPRICSSPPSRVKEICG
jgi:nicotinamidase-related amidase